MQSTERAKNSPPVLVCLAWMFVGIPLGWGVYRTAYQSAGLFHANTQTNVPATMPKSD